METSSTPVTTAQKIRAALSIIALPLPVVQLYVGIERWNAPCLHVDAQGKDAGQSLQCWLVFSGATTLSFLVILGALIVQGIIAAGGAAVAEQNKKDMREELARGTMTPEGMRRAGENIQAAETVAGTMGAAMAISLLCCYAPLICFSGVWFILGNVWFWSYAHRETCDALVFDTSFATLAYSYVMILLGCFASGGFDPVSDGGYEHIPDGAKGI